MQTYPSHLFVPDSRATPPADLYPLRFRHYVFDRTEGGSLLLPIGGIRFDGSMRVHRFEIQESDEMLPTLCVIKGRKSKRRRHHIVESSRMPSNPVCGLATPICGQAIRRWERLTHNGETITICTKSGYDDDGQWCYECVQDLRRNINAVSEPDSGRVTHIMLVPFPEKIMNTSGPLDAIKNKDSILFLTYVNDKVDHDKPQYGYCNKCREPYHWVRDEQRVTDWGS